MPLKKLPLPRISPPPQRSTKSATRTPRSRPTSEALPRALPARDGVHRAKMVKSTAKAKAAFKSFTLSRFGAAAQPDHYKKPDEHVTVAQRRTITAHLKQQSAAVDRDGVPQRAMTLALPPDVLKKLLPSHNRNKVDLDEVVNVLTKYMRGRELVANGDPTLNRLALQSKISKIFASLASTQATNRRVKK